MPKSLVLGNGTSLICMDEFGQVKDLYYPHVGLESHTSNCVHKIGIWVNGSFSWLSDKDWRINIDYEKDTLVSDISAKNNRLGLELKFSDFIYNEQNIFVREIIVNNSSNNERDIRLFLNQQFKIGGFDYGNTGYFDPEINSIIHYRGKNVFLVTGSSENKSFDEYSIGLFGNGEHGTWKDAEDGILSGNPVEHGNVDSTFSFHKKAAPRSTFSVLYTLIMAENISVAKGLLKFSKNKTLSHIKKSTTSYWSAWVNKTNIDFADMDDSIEALFKKSLLIIRTHIDINGSIIASGDSDILQSGKDTYSYMWPRDAAITAMALDRAGYFEITNMFFKFCNDIISEEGFLHHKYRSDKTLGSSWHPWIYNNKRQLAIQEDETSIVLIALWNHYKLHKNLEFIESIYNSFIKKVADFLYFYRDDLTALPYGSYDLWEEKFGTSTYTAATVVGALSAAASFAKLLGKESEGKQYENGASSTKEAIKNLMFNHKSKYYSKTIDMRQTPHITDNSVDISSIYGVFRYNITRWGQRDIEQSFKTLEDTLCCNVKIGSVGGAVRYVNDLYHQIDSNLPGNPWFITTLWLYQMRISRAKELTDLVKVREDLMWVCQRALDSGILSEQLNPHTGEQISVAPLIWSHAEFIHTTLDYIEKYHQLRRR